MILHLYETVLEEEELPVNQFSLCCPILEDVRQKIMNFI